MEDYQAPEHSGKSWGRGAPDSFMRSLKVFFPPPLETRRQFVFSINSTSTMKQQLQRIKKTRNPMFLHHGERSLYTKVNTGQRHTKITQFILALIQTCFLTGGETTTLLHDAKWNSHLLQANAPGKRHLCSKKSLLGKVLPSKATKNLYGNRKVWQIRSCYLTLKSMYVLNTSLVQTRKPINILLL